ncbi:heme o synthase [Afifella sp. IM 167]|uniref:heme o synthase n=1 Tax=Afifella sp. IM 167 TaxID=2033586 RepID=UPI001CC94BB3|nr:heme o synthase [Afifella sp. IM 167]MBZ8133456.1 protoheme IX farnesyltransferase [Afifella sp. IM 167]
MQTAAPGEPLAVTLAEPRDFFNLMKPRVMSLVIFTAMTGMIVAPGHLHPVLAFIGLLAIAVGAGASGVLNMAYEGDIDALMRRTATRPVPSGRVSAVEAQSFGLVLAVFSVMVLGLAVNWLAAALLAFTIFFYAVVYTMWLKRFTAQNIVIGGAAGALPPIIGWAAVTGDVGLYPVLLFLIIFLWTPPHFWALALFVKEDYGRAGVPMLPNVVGDAATRRQIFAYSLVLAPLGVTPFLFGYATPFYGGAAIVLGGLFVWRAVGVLREREADRHHAARALFGYSIVYLFAIFSVLLLDAAVGPSLAHWVASR